MLTWSGRSAFARIISAFLARGMRQFPICELTSKLKRNDPHHNFMPVITATDWVESSSFPDLAPQQVDAIEGPGAAALPTGDVTKPRDYRARREENLQPRPIGRATYGSGKPPREEAPPPPTGYDGPDDELDDDLDIPL